MSSSLTSDLDWGTMDTWNRTASELVDLLGLDHQPIAMTFTHNGAAGRPAQFAKPMSEPTPDGRSGRVPASCVFWMEAADATFATVPADHGNCSVGRWVHGFAPLEEIAGAADVGALFESGWVTTDDVGKVQIVEEDSTGIVYGPLRDATPDPDVVVLRLTPAQMMELGDAIPELELSGKPQCQIVAKAMSGQAAVSMGCALSRARTGMPATELTCAIPAGRLPAIVDRLRSVVGADRVVESYAADDRTRFS